MAELKLAVCPKCGKAIEADSRFVIWCEHCDWNLDGAGEGAPNKGAGRRAEERAQKRGQALFLEMRGSKPERPGPSAARTGSFALAVAIHGSTVGVLVLGLNEVISNYRQTIGFVLGIPLILLALLLRPNLGKIAPDAIVLSPTAAPTMYDLVNRISRDLGGHPIDGIFVNPMFNAGHGQIGVRRRRILWLGLALWNVLDDEQRVALVAHEIAHQVNGDLAHGLIVGTALDTLADWDRILSVRFRSRPSNNLVDFVAMLGELIAIGLMRIAGLAVNGLYRLEESLLFRSQQGAEYYADRLAAEVASTDAIVGCLDHLNLARPCMLVVRFAAQREQDVWEAERQYVADLTAKEWDRLRRLSARAGTAVDSSHPPSNLRIALLREQPEATGRIKLADGESQAIATEMAHAYAAVSEHLVSRLAI